MSGGMNEAVARAILLQAMTEGRCGELLDCLFNGGTCTVDLDTRKLLLIPGSALEAAFGSDDEDEETPACPHVVTEGTTSHCTLAAETEARYRRSLDARADLELDNEGLSRHVTFMERYRMRAARLEAEARVLLDGVKDRLDSETVADATPDSFHEGFVDALTRVIAHPAAVRLRQLLDEPIPELAHPGHPGGDNG